MAENNDPQLLEFINNYSLYALQSNNASLDMKSVLNEYKSEIKAVKPNFKSSLDLI